MPSQILNSGMTTLVSGQIYSGCPFPVDGILVYLDKNGPLVSGNPVVIGCALSGTLSGYSVSFNSGGTAPLTSGGLLDGFPLYPGEQIFISKGRLLNGGGAPVVSGAAFGVQVFTPAGSSGCRLYWEYDIRRM